MNSTPPGHPGHHRSRPQPRRPARPPLSSELLAARTLEVPPSLPRIVVKSPTSHPFLYRKRLGDFDRTARHGALVQLMLPSGESFGYGLFNPRAEIAVRVLSHGDAVPDEAWWADRIRSAVELRRAVLRLDDTTDAYRVIHAESDGLPGLVADRLGPVLSIEVFSLAMYQRAEAIAGLLANELGTEQTIVQAAPQTLELEGFAAEPKWLTPPAKRLEIQEFGTRFAIDFSAGHKTGFFCDQRDNRRRLAEFCQGAEVLDLCCYTGGFSVQAARLGKASSVIGVDLDEQAIEIAKKNANLNQTRVRFVHADAFNYLRDMLRAERQFDVVVLDPPKLIRTRSEQEEGRRKYYDFNRLAMQLVRPGGLLLTCSCSGLMSQELFLRTVSSAVPGNRRGQILFRTSAGPDHPVATDCWETDYLKAFWVRVL